MTGKSWSAEEEDILKSNYDKISATEIGKILERTTKAVTARASKLGLTEKGRYNTQIKWKNEDVVFLKENYYRLRASQIAEKIGRNIKSIQSKAKQIGLTKAPPKKIGKEILSLLSQTSLSINQISQKVHVSPYRIKQLMKDSNFIRKKEGRAGWGTLSLLEGFHYHGNRVGRQRAQFLYAYKRTCWDCKRTFVNDKDLVIHHDFSKLPVQILLLCTKCHKERHNIRK